MAPLFKIQSTGGGEQIPMHDGIYSMTSDNNLMDIKVWSLNVKQYENAVLEIFYESAIAR
jgi:hypothetical protein